MRFLALLAATMITGGACIDESQMLSTELLQQDHTARSLPVTNGSGATPEATAWTPVTVPLQKQYVPVPTKDGTIFGYKTSYFGEVTTGSDQRQRFTVVFDTGSGHFLLPSTACKSPACAISKRYDRHKSPSVVDIEMDGRPLNASDSTRDQVSIAFGTGQVLGEFVEEEVCLGRGKTGCVNLRAVMALELSDDPFKIFAFDGVLGLGLDPLSLNQRFNFFGEMIGQKSKMPPHFAIFLSRSDEGESKITFGGHDERLATTPFEYVPIAKPELGFWQVQIMSVKIGDEFIEECENGACHAILDSGTSLFGVPREVHRTMHAKLARPIPKELESSPDGIDCRTVPGKKIIFNLGGGIFVSLQEEDYSRPVPVNMTVPAKNTSNSSSNITSNSNISGNGSTSEEQKDAYKLMCRSFLLPVDKEGSSLGSKVFIFGEPFLRRYYTLWDFEKKRVGFSLAGPHLPRSEAARAMAASIPPPPLGSLLPGSPLPSMTSKKAAGSAGTNGEDSTDNVVSI